MSVGSAGVYILHFTHWGNIRKCARARKREEMKGENKDGDLRDKEWMDIGYVGEKMDT